MRQLIIFFLLFFNPLWNFSQKLFSKEELLVATDGGDRWHKDILIFLYGDYSKQDSLDVVENIKFFNSLIKPIKISLIKNKDSANVVMYFLTDDEFSQLTNRSKSRLKNIGVSFICVPNHKIKSVDIHIDITENNKFESFSDTIRHEMFHMLGFTHYDEQKDSILDNNHDYLTNKDIEMVKYLYSETKN
jgi:hypothetical protein